MQPARHTRAIAAERQVPAELLRGGGEQAEALGVAGDLAGEQRLLEEQVLLGPAPHREGAIGKIAAPCRRSSSRAEMLRAATAASIAVAGAPSICASIAVHRPVPFCPARSRITSTIGLPVSGSVAAQTFPVISTR